MVNCITEQGGMLDKFIGDAIMAAFGLPISHEDDEDRGVKAGINMIVRLWEWNEQREKDRKKKKFSLKRCCSLCDNCIQHHLNYIKLILLTIFQ